MKPTKKPKKVRVEWYESTCFTSEYTCPSCRNVFDGFVGSKNVLRFRCRCGQELIVENAKV